MILSTWIGQRGQRADHIGAHREPSVEFGDHQRKYSEKSTLILGFRTDRNQRLVDQDLQTLSFLSTSPSIFHLSCGGFFTFNKTSFPSDWIMPMGKKRRMGAG
ncbi:MAG: hypothetical protein R2825_02430 [Saprospiraceae bacterium]